MAKRKKKNKIIRYLAVFKRGIKKLNRKKIYLWLKFNFKQHPLILGILFFIWINELFLRMTFLRGGIIGIVKIHLYILALWLVLVTLSNLLKDKNKVKWYFKKRFVFFALIALFPFGLILLWSGTQFKRITKIMFTVIFGSFFTLTMVRYASQHERLANRPAFEIIMDKITQSKRKTHLKTLGQDVFNELQISSLPEKSRVKLAISEIASLCSPSVVSIKTKNKNGEELGMGSGFVISEDGFIVTNFHVVESAYQAEVKIGDVLFEEAYIVKGVPDLDIAILKVASKDLPFLSLGDSDGLVTGQFVIVLGNPMGLERSVSSGIISAMRLRGDIKIIQMTAPVSLGSSGGPVINEYGEVIGITTLASFFMTQNLNFAIPINYISKIINKK